MSATTAPPIARPVDIVRSLRRVYLVRFGFALVWAVLFALTSSPLGGVGLALAVLYPAFDLVAAVVDARTTSPGRRPRVLYVNMALSLAAAVALAVVGSDDPGDVLVVWGLWAITAGAVQLLVGLGRRALGGQWPMMLSGGISVLAGASFVASASGTASLTGLAGYATLGGLFFLASALRLGTGRTRAGRP